MTSLPIMELLIVVFLVLFAVLYYIIKGDAERGDYDNLLEHIDELKSLNLLSIENDSMIFDNILFQIANFIKSHISLTDIDAFDKVGLTITDIIPNIIAATEVAIDYDHKDL